MTIAFEPSYIASSVRNRAAAPVITSELRAGLMFAGALVVIAICAAVASPQPAADAVTWMGLIGGP
jgi:hypothetical protein